MIKGQVQTPMRSNGVFKQSGLRGSVHSVDSVEDVVNLSEKMMGKFMLNNLVPHMTDGYLCNSVLVNESVDIEQEFFLKIDYDYCA